MKRRKFIKGSAIVGLSAATPLLLQKGSGMFTKKTNRKIYTILDAGKTTVGTLPIFRAFAGDHTDYVSPFVLFDEFGPVNINAGDDPLRVDAHPHAGVIPTTYFLSGSGHHKDSLNYDFQIAKGDFMLFSSGKGAIHMEESGNELYEKGGSYHGFQIWLNMPAEYKFIDPTTYVFQADKMGEIDNDQFSAKVILGDLQDAKSKIQTLSPTFYYHIKIKPNGRIDIPTDPLHNAFVYNINGSVELEGQKLLTKNQVVLYQRGDSVINLYSKEGAEMLVLGGQPLNEPVFSYGPFVMNNEDQMRKTVQAYQNGEMGDPELVN
ncbi:MAG: pirin family protein [Saprospiraceae bacterium]